MSFGHFKIPVNKPFLPNQEVFQNYLHSAWERNWLTNHGPLVKELEKKISDFVQIPYVLFVNNGTFAIQLAIKALGIQGEIITTPFSYVATTNSILWQGCTPIFADIHPKTLGIDPSKLEEKITSNTKAILATHVFGIPNDVEILQKIAENYTIPVIYDGAHSFGCEFKGKSLLSYGDISTVSFHSTKLFHTVEGGAVFTSNEFLYQKMKQLMNFGHTDLNEFESPGVNGKNSEFHAAMGLANFDSISQIIEKRKQLFNYYKQILPEMNLEFPEIPNHTQYNFPYFPIILNNETALLYLKEKLETNGIESRRYFYPSLSKLNYLENKQQDTPISDSISERILCLPLYYDLTFAEIDSICELIEFYL